jgi:transposase
LTRRQKLIVVRQALNYLTKQFVVEEYSAGNEDNMVAFWQYLQSLYAKDTRLVIIWDGASYHRSQVVQEFLGQTNGGLSPEA